MIIFVIFAIFTATVASKHVVEVKAGDARNCYEFVSVVDKFRSSINYDVNYNYEKYVPEMCKTYPLQCKMYKKAASMICQKYPVQCGKYKEMLPIVVSLLENDFNYDHICTLLYPLPGSDKPNTFPEQFAKSSPLCTGCKIIVKAIRFQVKVLNETRQAIISGIKVLCHLIPILKVQEKICTDVTDYIDKIIQEILSGLSPSDICVKLKLCDAPKKVDEGGLLGADWEKIFPKMLQKHINQATEGSSSLGSDWKKLYPGISKEGFGNDWKKLYPGISKEGFENDWKDLNPGMEKQNREIHSKQKTKKNTAFGSDWEKLFPGIKEHKKAMKRFGEDWENIMPNVEKHIEKTIPVVGAKFEKFMKSILESFGVKPKELDNEVGCTVCKTIVQYIDWEVTQVNGSIEFIINTVKDFCKLDPIQSTKQVCNEIVDKIETVIELIGKEIAPEQICEELKLCSNATVVQSRDLFSRRDCHQVCGHMRMVSNYDLKLQLAALSKSGNTMKKLCGESNASKAKCTNIMKLIKKVGNEAGDVIQATDARYCECTLHPQDALLIMFGQPTRSNDLCKMCHKFEKTMEEDLVKVNKTMLALVEAMDDICDFLSGPMKQRCSTVVGDIKSFAEYLEKKINPSGICKAMSICPSNK